MERLHLGAPARSDCVPSGYLKHRPSQRFSESPECPQEARLWVALAPYLLVGKTKTSTHKKQAKLWSLGQPSRQKLCLRNQYVDVAKGVDSWELREERESLDVNLAREKPVNPNYLESVSCTLTFLWETLSTEKLILQECRDVFNATPWKERVGHTVEFSPISWHSKQSAMVINFSSLHRLSDWLGNWSPDDNPKPQDYASSFWYLQGSGFQLGVILFPR